MPTGVYKRIKPSHRKGVSHSDKTKFKMSLAKIGVFVGNKSPLWKGGRPKCLDCNKQLVSYSSTHCKKCSGIIRKSKHYSFKRTQTFKDNLSRYSKLIGRTPPSFKDKHHSKEIKERLSEWHIENPNLKFKDTKIELKIEAELKRLGIKYQKQVPLCKKAIVDFYIPEQKIVIQADGCYWHGCPIHFPKGVKGRDMDRDERQNKVLITNGFDVHRFWEHEINKSVEECINKLNIKQCQTI